MCSRTRENDKNKVGTVLWDTLYIEEPLASKDKIVEEEVHDADYQTEDHRGEAVDDEAEHDHIHVVAGECGLCDYYKLQDKTHFFLFPVCTSFSRQKLQNLPKVYWTFTLPGLPAHECQHVKTSM